MDKKSKMIAKLNDILKWEWTGVAQYAQYSFVVHGVWREVYSKMFMGSADESFGHAKTIGDKIVSLGGVPTIERDRVKQTDSLAEMLQNSLAFESKAVEHYTQALEICEDAALRVLLEDILLEEQEGVDHLSKLLRESSGAGGLAQDSKSKTG